MDLLLGTDVPELGNLLSLDMEQREAMSVNYSEEEEKNGRMEEDLDLNKRDLRLIQVIVV